MSGQKQTDLTTWGMGDHTRGIDWKRVRECDPRQLADGTWTGKCEFAKYNPGKPCRHALSLLVAALCQHIKHIPSGFVPQEGEDLKMEGMINLWHYRHEEVSELQWLILLTGYSYEEITSSLLRGMGSDLIVGGHRNVYGATFIGLKKQGLIQFLRYGKSPVPERHASIEGIWTLTDAGRRAVELGARHGEESMAEMLAESAKERKATGVAT